MWQGCSLSSQEQQQIDAHRELCPACAKDMDDMIKLIRQVDDAVKQIPECPPGLKGRILNTIEAAPHSFTFSRSYNPDRNWCSILAI
jgi:hypothetical protein